MVISNINGNNSIYIGAQRLEQIIEFKYLVKEHSKVEIGNRINSGTNIPHDIQEFLKQ